MPLRTGLDWSDIEILGHISNQNSFLQQQPSLSSWKIAAVIIIITIPRRRRDFYYSGMVSCWTTMDEFAISRKKGFCCIIDTLKPDSTLDTKIALLDTMYLSYCPPSFSHHISWTFIHSRPFLNFNFVRIMWRGNY